MPHSRTRKSKARRTPKAHPRGVLELTGAGYGFVQTSEGEFFIPASKTADAFDGDLVEVSHLPHGHEGGRAFAVSGGRPPARVVRVLARAHETVVGRYEVAEPFGVVVPEDPRIKHDIFTLRRDAPHVQDGDIVRVRMTVYPSRREPAQGVVEEVLGHSGDSGVDVELVIARHKLETRFSDAALEEVRDARVDAQGALASGRYWDYTDRVVFTVDPDDAKDFDDALSLDCVVLADDACVDAATSSGVQSCRDEFCSTDEQNVPSRACNTGTEHAIKACSPRSEVRYAREIPPILGTGETLADVSATCKSFNEATEGLSGTPGSRSLPDAGPDGASRGAPIGEGPEKAYAPVNAPKHQGFGRVFAGSFADGAKLVARGDALWRLGVHIADVSHYVPWGSSVDLNARRRATSVYLVDRVLPMLPEKLSNDVCSLKPHEERRAVSVDLFLDAQGRVVGMDASPSVIRSCARLAYGWVQHALEAQREGERDAALACIKEAAGPASEAVLERLVYLDEIAHKLHAARIARGGMDFESEEAKVRLDAQGRPVSVDVRVKTDATSLVEEAMIAANEAVARYLRDAKVSSIYRVHDAPSPTDLVDLKPILQEFGYDKRVSMTRFCSGDPFAIQEVLAAAQGRREEYLVSSLIVRAMRRAVYRDACGPHFGLASEAYTHFTSPIRRYPDLMVHRMLKCALFGRSEETSAIEAAMTQIAQHSSEAERTAEAAARESQELKLYELLEQHVGEEADGIVSGVVSAGFFVRLADTTEGFVALRAAGEYWMLDAQRRTLTGSDSGGVIRLGMRVRIRIKDVRPLERRADFALVSKGRGIGLRLRG